MTWQQRKRKRYFPCTIEIISQGRKYVSVLNYTSVEAEAARRRLNLSSRFTLDSGSMFIRVVPWVRPGFSWSAGSSRQIPVFARSRLDQLLPALLTDVYVLRTSSLESCVFLKWDSLVNSAVLASTLLVRWEFTSGHSCSVSDILGL